MTGTIKKQLSDREVAVEILRLQDVHEASWDDTKQTFLQGRLWGDNIEPFLETQRSAFAQALKLFGWQYTNDVLDLCQGLIQQYHIL